MSNQTTVFTTQRNGDYGSSLYLVTTDWVLRCSGNTNGREATTFARKRDISYTKSDITLYYPAVGFTPKEGKHTGNLITAVLNKTGKIPQDAPANWNSENGVSWESAAEEIRAAEAATRLPVAETGRFSRKVGEQTFKND